MLNFKALDGLTISKNQEDFVKAGFALLLFVLFLRAAPFATAETRCGPDRIGGTVFVDVNENGQRENNEPAVSAAKISIYDDDGQLIDNTISDHNGKYVFIVGADDPVWVSYGAENGEPAGTSIANAIGSCSTHLAVAPSAGLCPEGAVCHSFDNS